MRRGRGGQPRVLRAPTEHWPKLRSTDPPERFNREIAWRTDVIGIFPDDPTLIRLVSMLAIEVNNEWLVRRGDISQQSIDPLLDERLIAPDRGRTRTPARLRREHLHRRPNANLSHHLPGT
jgi:hypothetical protein